MTANELADTPNRIPVAYKWRPRQRHLRRPDFPQTRLHTASRAYSWDRLRYHVLEYQDLPFFLGSLRSISVTSGSRLTLARSNSNSGNCRWLFPISPSFICREILHQFSRVDFSKDTLRDALLSDNTPSATNLTVFHGIWKHISLGRSFRNDTSC